MATYKDLQEQIANLQSQAEEARQNEISSAIADIREKMQMYGITVEDLASAKNSQKSKVKTKAAAKYSNPESGDTWSGRGRQPKWLAGKDREKFLVQ
jgi:DNA-binding protein H-NS